jgi:hypothetical protein
MKGKSMLLAHGGLVPHLHAADVVALLVVGVVLTMALLRIGRKI